jgi:hypothetical protein
MFQVSVNVAVRIAGCPKKGIEAVKFREEHGIPSAPDDRIALKFWREDRAICEMYAKHLNAYADLELGNSEGSSPKSFEAEIPIEWAVNTESNASNIIGAIYQDIEKERIQKYEEKVQAYLSASFGDLVEYRPYYEKTPYIRKNQEYWEKATLDPRCAEKVKKINAEIAERTAAHAEQMEEERLQNLKKAEEAERKNAEDAKREEVFVAALWAWIDENGSENQKSRKARNLLSVDEAKAALTDSLFAPLSSWKRYERMTSKDVCDCEYETCKVEFETLEGEAVKLDSAQFDALVAIENLMPKDTKVSPRMHVGTSEDCDNRVERCGYSVTAEWGGKKFTREYMA